MKQYEIIWSTTPDFRYLPGYLQDVREVIRENASILDEWGGTTADKADCGFRVQTKPNRIAALEKALRHHLADTATDLLVAEYDPPTNEERP